MMHKYFKYLWYVIRHKWFVFCECFREGLYWRGIVHDMSKLLPSEFIPYANFFYGAKGHGESKLWFKPIETFDKKFDHAWLMHQKRNDHHWQYFVLPEDDGGVKVLPMTEQSRREMVCDWIGAGKTQGHFPESYNRYSEVCLWYRVYKNKMQLHPDTRKWVELKIGYIEDDLPIILNSNTNSLLEWFSGDKGFMCRYDGYEYRVTNLGRYKAVDKYWSEDGWGERWQHIGIALDINVCKQMCWDYIQMEKKNDTK